MNDIIKIIKLLEDSGVLIDGISEMGKHEIKQGRILAALLAPLTFNCNWKKSAKSRKRVYG